MDRYMVPVHVSFHEALPKTPTVKAAIPRLKAWHAANAPEPVG